MKYDALFIRYVDDVDRLTPCIFLSKLLARSRKVKGQLLHYDPHFNN